MSDVKAGGPRWVVVATAAAGLVAALFVAAAKCYELQKARAEAARSADAAREQPPAPAPPAPAGARLAAGSVWAGHSTWAEGPRGPTPCKLVVTNRTGDTFHGLYSWGFGDKESVTEVEGTVRGAEVTMRERAWLKRRPGGAVVPCEYAATLTGGTL